MMTPHSIFATFRHPMNERLFFVEVEPLLFQRLAPALKEHGFDAVRCEDDAELFERLEPGQPCVVVAAMGASVDSKTCERLAREYPAVEVILSTQSGDAEILDMIRSVNVDFIAQPLSLPPLVARLKRAVRHRNTRLEVAKLRQSIADQGGFQEIIGTSPPMQELFELLDRASRTDASALITGESGTGKELVARALHSAGKRGQHPFVAVNCSAVPEMLLESELFGHAKGAFTDAQAARAGLFVKASGGTILLDEIGDMPLALQPKLLRVLQERTVRPVGRDEETPIDVRVIAATNRNLEEAVTAREFREDLFYRLHVIRIEVPPLRERGGDILLLAERFIQHFSHTLAKDVSGVSRRAGDRLMAYGWPGNVRELQNCIERAVALTREEEILLADLPPRIRDYEPNQVLVVSNEPAELVPLDEVERRYIIRVLDAVDGNKKQAATILGLDRKTLYRKLTRYQLAADGPSPTE